MEVDARRSWFETPKEQRRRSLDEVSAWNALVSQGRFNFPDGYLHAANLIRVQNRWNWAAKQDMRQGEVEREITSLESS